MNGENFINSGHGKTPAEAIRACQQARIQEDADRREAAKRLLGIF